MAFIAYVGIDTGNVFAPVSLMDAQFLQNQVNSWLAVLCTEKSPHQGHLPTEQ